VVFGVLLILFARFVPLGAVGTMRMWRPRSSRSCRACRWLRSVPAPVPAPQPMQDDGVADDGAGTAEPPPSSVTDADSSPVRDDESAP
jgi:hypothetical protein